ncbi:MAG: B12-binding domain-containing radical SAM protein [Gemmatimonadetes bacterium]|nr:B12-binding domain-containing radical SAM protein [Gemmatimonadota bacterium]
MIILVNPRATRPANRRFPLSVMAIGAALPPDVSWVILDGNRPGSDPLTEAFDLIRARAGGADPVLAVAITVMPGPQFPNAVTLTKSLKARHPAVPIVWGGNFPSLYPRPVLNAPYVDWLVRGQGERTFVELLQVLRGDRDPKSVAGLAFRDGGRPWVGPERRWAGPDELPAPPYHKIDVPDYLRPTLLGSRSGVYQASIGCPYSCNFCGVISVYGSREKVESPARTERYLSFLVREYGMNAVHFYDNNFFLREGHAVELAERLAPLALSWWCEARVDAMLRFSDATWRTLKRSGLRMVFFGAESGSDEVLRRMAKRLTTAQIEELAGRARTHGIIPEFSFVLGDPDEPRRELENTFSFIRRLKHINPRCEIITYLYTPTPQRHGTYGGVDPLSGTPETLEGWAEPQWMGWMTHEDPQVPWMTADLKAQIEDFQLVLRSRFPSVHDLRTRRWGQEVARWLAARRWRSGRYGNPRLLRAVHRLAQMPAPDEQAYGHLRPEGAAR